MKFSTLLVLLLLSPASAFASGELISNVSSAASAKNKMPSVSGVTDPCAAPDKMLRDACVKKPETSASRDSVGSETVERDRPSRVKPVDGLVNPLVKPIKITPLVKPRNAAASQVKPSSSPEAAGKPADLMDGSGSARHKPSIGFKG